MIYLIYLRQNSNKTYLKYRLCFNKYVQIFVIYQNNNETYTDTILFEMAVKIKHRGPDNTKQTVYSFF